MIQGTKSLGLKNISSGGGGTGEITGTVSTYANLPAASSVSGKFYLVQTGSGIYLINRKPAGLYYSDGAVWTSTPDLPTYFNDTNFQIFNNADNTKLLEIALGSIATGNTRTLTMADADVDLADVASISGKLSDVVDDTTPQLGGNLDVNGKIITGFTASRALESDASGHIAVSAVTLAELNYLDGVSSSIQTQLNGKLADQTIGIADDNLLEVDGSPNSAEYARFTANGLEGRIESEFKADFNLEIGTDVLAQQTIGIADNNLLEVDGSPNDDEIARFTANGIEGRTNAEMKTQLAYLTDLADDSTPQLAGDLDCQANTVGFTQQTVTYNSGTTTVDWGAGNKAKMTFGAGNITTFAFTNPTKPGNFLLVIVQDGTGSRLVSAWDADILWAGGAAPTLSTGVSAVDILSFYWDGTNYHGVASLDFS